MVVSNVYAHPERHGLEVVGELNDPDLSDRYGFHTFVVWREILSGRVFYAADEGCSCPTPFDDFASIEDLTEVTTGSYGEFAVDVAKFGGANTEPAFACDKVELLSNVSKLL